LSKLSIRDAVERISELPTLPAVLGQMMEVAADPDSSAIDLAKHIAADPSISATLLRLVNSAYYGFYRQVDSVAQAVVILGFGEVRNIIFAAKAFEALKGKESSFDRRQLWRHSLATAIASERCARTLGWASDGSYYVAGLLHDIGKVTLDVLYPDLYEEAVRIAHDEKTTIRAAEKRVFDIDHASVGALLADHWGLTEPVVEAIRLHHVPVQSRSATHLAAVIAMADYLTYGAGIGEASNATEAVLPEGVQTTVRLDEGQVESIREHLNQTKDRIDDFVGVMAE
jgi:putative nucleotidyltransferase with HDIG domain